MKRLTVISLALAVLVIGGAGYVGARRSGGAGDPPVAPPATITVGRGEVQQTVTAPGHLQATRQASLALAVSGRLVEVNARPGESVAAGAALARIDSADLELQLQTTQVNLKVAQDHLAQARVPGTAQDIANARAHLAAAQAGYDKLSAGPSAADLAAARAAVGSAQAAYDAALRSAGTRGSQIEASAAALARAENALRDAQARYDRVASNPDIGMRPESNALQSATIDFDQAKANYEALAATAGSDAQARVEASRSQLQAAQAGLVRLQAPAAAADLASAQAQLTQAHNDLDKLLAGPEANALDIAQNGVTQAEIAVRQAQLKLDGARLTAPFSGVVVEVRASPGDVASAGATLIVLCDTTSVEALGTVIEEDLGLVQAGQAVDLFFDAMPEAAVKGRVGRIVPLRDTSNNRTAYPVAVTLEDLPAGLLPGMTVDASIVIAERRDVLRLPRALARAGANGKTTVQVWLGDHAEPRTITTGLRGDVYVEVVSGLAAGEQVMGQ